jgi:hypothetical protein
MTSYDDSYGYFRRLWQEERDRVLAACRAAGLLTGLAEGDYPGTCADRLARIRDAVEELRAALDLNPAFSTTANRTGGDAR